MPVSMVFNPMSTFDRATWAARVARDALLRVRRGTSKEHRFAD
jgi:hypothetical protein